MTQASVPVTHILIITSMRCTNFSNLFSEYISTYFGQVFCPKHVEFYSKNKFEKFVHLVGFITRIYHDARSSECQKLPVTLSHFCTKNLM